MPKETFDLEIFSFERLGEEKRYFVSLNDYLKYSARIFDDCRTCMFSPDGDLIHLEADGVYTQEPLDASGRLWLRKSLIRPWLLRNQVIHGFLTCAGCGSAMPDGLADADHIEPRAHGGSHDLSNRILLCRPCNVAKSDVHTLQGLRMLNAAKGRMVDWELAVLAEEHIRKMQNNPWLSSLCEM